MSIRIFWGHLLHQQRPQPNLQRQPCLTLHQWCVSLRATAGPGTQPAGTLARGMGFLWGPHNGHQFPGKGTFKGFQEQENLGHSLWQVKTPNAQEQRMAQHCKLTLLQFKKNSSSSMGDFTLNLLSLHVETLLPSTPSPAGPGWQEQMRTAHGRVSHGFYQKSAKLRDPWEEATGSSTCRHDPRVWEWRPDSGTTQTL